MARTREFDTDSVVAAATETFRRKGYAGASLRDLSEATGIGSGSLYAAFGSKEGLYLAALDQYRARYAHALIDQLNAENDPVAAVRSAFARAVDVMIDDARERSCLIVGAAAECAHAAPEVAERLKATTESLRRALARTLAQAREQQRLASAADPDDLARFLVTTFQGLRVMAAIDPDRSALHRAAEVAVDSVFDAASPRG
jgi:TetR/AcrR family transcriptional repressor of nem operon